MEDISQLTLEQKEIQLTQRYDKERPCTYKWE